MATSLLQPEISQESPSKSVNSATIVEVVLPEPRAYSYTVWHHGMWYGMAAAACALLLFCALIAGLTLAVCGLESTWLKMRGVTGTPKERKRALVVAKMKRHSTWMLCSLIICSVAAGESFPFLIQGLWHGHQQWVPILISTLSIAVFAEILPQYIIPRNAIDWGYYCCPIIWSCMLLTGIVSYPLAFLLDTLSGNKGKHEIFTNDEMAALIKYHERSENHGGNIDRDTARILLGALNLNSRKVGGDISRIPEDVEDEKFTSQDVEKADLVVSHGMIVPWSAVKTIGIDEPVDGAFIQRVKSWSYSRIPVIDGSGRNSIEAQSWEGKRIFGFLHIKNLLGLEIDEVHDLRTGIFVRDLPLYPLPIIQEQVTIYGLLNIFQLGMSRMAVVVPKPLKGSPESLAVSPKSLPESRGPCWTATQRTNARIVSRMKTVGSQADWTTDWATGFLDASQIDIQNQLSRKENVVGVRAPRPVGIITFEDIIDTILQKTSRDERDFFDRDSTAPPTKKKKAGDFLAYPVCGWDEDKENSSGLASVENTHVSFQRPARGTVRKRKVSKTKKTIVTMDGADDRSYGSADDRGVSVQETHSHHRQSQKDGLDVRGDILTVMDGVEEAKFDQLTKTNMSHANREESSYTQSSQGGFHNAESILGVQEDSANKTTSLPSRRGVSSLLSDGVGIFWRNVSASPALPQLQRVTLFSREHYSGFEKQRDERLAKSNMAIPTNFISPVSSFQSLVEDQVQFHRAGAELDGAHSIHEEIREAGPKDSGFIHSLNSWNYDDLLDAQDQIRLGQEDAIMGSSIREPSTGNSPSASMIPGGMKSEPYNGIPPELLDSMNSGRAKGNPDYLSKTLPRMTIATKEYIGEASGDTLIQEQSFHDDRILLPNQCKDANSSVAANVDGMRSSSFWI